MSLPRPTSLGIKAVLFYLLLVGAFAATPYSNLFFLLLAFLTILGLLNFFWTAGNVAGAEGGIAAPEPMPAGAGAPISAQVAGGPRVRLALAVELRLGNDGGVVRLPAGVVRGDVRLAGRLPALERGVYPVERAALVSSWPLGLLEARREIEAPAEIVVFPAPAEPSGSASGAGLLDSLRGAGADGNMQPSHLREYVDGDELRRVHWKASARRGGLVIQEWEGGTGSGHELLLDRRAEAAAFETALGVVAAAALAAQESKEPLTLHTQELSATFGTGHRPLAELLRFLAGVQRLPEDGPPPPPVSPTVPRLPA